MHCMNFSGALLLHDPCMQSGIFQPIYIVYTIYKVYTRIIAKLYACIDHWLLSAVESFVRSIDENLILNKISSQVQLYE